MRSQIVSNLCKNLKNPFNFSNVSLTQQSELSKMLSKNSINCVWCLNTVLVIREVKFHLVGATNGSFLAVPLTTACAPPPFWYTQNQRWSLRGRPWPRGHTLKSLASASKVKSLTSRSQVLENWPVLGSRTALFFFNKLVELL